MADGLRAVADWLDELYVEGVEIADGTTDGHRWFTATDPAVAEPKREKVPRDAGRGSKRS
jgi:hypothetical protein